MMQESHGGGVDLGSGGGSGSDAYVVSRCAGGTALSQQDFLKG